MKPPFLLLVAAAAVLHGNANGGGGDVNSHLVQPVRIGSDSDFSVFDCDFDLTENCLWTWEKDNVTDVIRSGSVLPGQHGFYQMTGEDVVVLSERSGGGKFFGPSYDRFGSEKGKSKEEKIKNNIFALSRFPKPGFKTI
jgi:hypothetical protein